MSAALDILLQDWHERLRAWSVDGSLASAARHALELEGEQPLLTELVAQVGQAISVTASYTDAGGTAESLTSAATAVVTNTNDSPTADADTASTTENAALSAASLDATNDPINLTTASVFQSGNAITFNPGNNFDFLATGETATVTINYTVTDDDGTPLTDNGILSITVTGTNDGSTEPSSPVLTIIPDETDNGGSVVINPESIPQGDETLVISSSGLPEDTQPIFELSGGVDSTVSLSIDFQTVDESSTPINPNQSTDGGGSIPSNVPQNLTLSLDGVYFNSGAGNDSIIGTAFNDFLRAGAGDDTIDAGGGNDIVRAGAGSDRITLGTGNDTLYLTDDQLDGSTDVVTDFNSAEDSITFAENLTVSLAGNIATFTTEIDDVERSAQLIFSGFNTLSDEWFSIS